MSVGFLICMYYLLATSFIGTPAEQLSRRWFNTAPLSSGVFGIAAGFIIIWLVSYVTKAPDQKTQDMIESVRYPRLG
jgi:cation/acetate symporter